MLQGIFVGYKQRFGGGWDNKDLWVAYWDQTENAEHVSDIHPKRFHYKAVEVKLNNGKLVFPLADGTLRQPVSDRYRNSSSRRRAKGELARDDDDEDERADTDEEDEPTLMMLKNPQRSLRRLSPLKHQQISGAFLGKPSIFIM